MPFLPSLISSVMGISIDHYRVAIGLFHNCWSTPRKYDWPKNTADSEIMLSSCFLSLVPMNVILLGFTCLQHLLSVLQIFFQSCIDVHPNPGQNDPSAKNYLKLCHSNARSIKSSGKLDELQLLAQVENFDVITLSETWLDANFPDQLLYISCDQRILV